MIKLSPANIKVNIQIIKDAAKAVYPDSPILRDITIAQAILESGLVGTPSKLALMANNLFGIKGRGTAGTVYMDTKEQDKAGKVSTIEAGFAKNLTIEDSLLQHKHLLENGPSFAPGNYQKVIDAKTFEEAANALVTAKYPYATDKKYPQKLIDIYNQYIKVSKE